MTIWIVLSVISLIIWIAILVHPDRPYQYREVLSPSDFKIEGDAQFISIVVPARNEEVALKTTLPALLSQNYPHFEIVLVDDHSEDKTAEIAREIAQYYPNERLQIVEGKVLPEGWVGKMWALSQGLQKAKGSWILLTDADILHPIHTLSSLMNMAQQRQDAQVSVMAKLCTESFWEKILIPAFLYFFKMLYPFSAVNKSHRRVAAAAGGCVLIQKQALDKIGGIESIRGEIIDDVSLAKKVKLAGHSISLWNSHDVISQRGYENLSGIWKMVSRTAFTELKYSYLMLLGCFVMMSIMFISPVIGMFAWNSQLQNIAIISTITYICCCASYYPTIRYFKLPFIFTMTLPIAGILYLFMTLDSAMRYTFGIRASWRGRNYSK